MQQESETVRLSDGGETLPLTGSDAPVVVPKRIGSVRLERELGRGGMGVVWRGRDDVLDRPVAVKFLLRTCARPDDPDFKDFLAGARAAAAVRHPGLTAVYQADLIHGVPYLVMEFVDGPNLGMVLRRVGPFEPALVARMMAEISRSVAALHERDIVHRDIKPENVLLSPEGELIVTDFGLACDRVPPMTSRAVKGLAGTPRYMAPELFGGNVSDRSDVYALGITAYELLTGDTPFRGSLDELRDAHLSGLMPEEPLRERNVPEEMILLLKRLTHPNRMYRAKSAHQAAQGFDRIIHTCGGKAPFSPGEVLLERWQTGKRSHDPDSDDGSTQHEGTVYDALNRFAEEKRKRQVDLESQMATRRAEQELEFAPPDPELMAQRPTGNLSPTVSEPSLPRVLATPRSVTSPPPMIDDPASPVQDGRVNCLSCGYDLRELPRDQNCPECGTPIERTMRGNLLIFSTPEHLRKLRRGVSCVIIGACGLLLSTVASLVMGFAVGLDMIGASSVVIAFDISMATLQVAMAALIMTGWWMASSPDPSILGMDRADWPRRVLRITMFIALLLFVIVMIGKSLDLFEVEHRVLLVSLLGLLTLMLIALAVLFIASMVYLRWLARRVPDRRAEQQAMHYLWLLPLLSTVGLCVLGLGPVAAAVLYVVLLNRIRLGINRVYAQQGQELSAEVSGSGF
jgi:serine/threonine protein kinase